MKIGIVGMGWVGASVAVSVLHKGVASELLLNDVREGLAEGEAMDLAHGSSFYPTASVRAAAIEEMVDADAVIVTAGKGGGPEDSRLDLLRINASIVADVAKRLRGMRGMLRGTRKKHDSTQWLMPLLMEQTHELQRLSLH